MKKDERAGEVRGSGVEIFVSPVTPGESTQGNNQIFNFLAVLLWFTGTNW